MKVRIVELKNSIRFVSDDEAYPLIRNVVLAYCENKLIPQNPLLSERVSAMSGKPDINNDGLPPRCGNEIEIFLRDAGLQPNLITSELKGIIRLLEIEIL